MKNFFLAAFVAVFGFANQTFAQSQLATLFQDGDVKTFYGINALRSAHSSAKHGDVITLSSGTFNSVDITKAITLRGAGMQYDSIAKTEPTILTGNLILAIPNDSTLQGYSLTMEGISFQNDIILKNVIYNAQFVKCGIRVLGNGSGDYLRTFVNASLINCYILALYIGPKGSVAAINSFIYNYSQKCNSSELASTSSEFQNCVLKFTDYPAYSTFRNCILKCIKSESYIPYTSTAYGCIAYNSFKNSNPFSNKLSNTYISELGDAAETLVFKTWNGSWYNNSIDGNLELTDAAKTKYLGTDGTQVGIYGGSIPFTARPSNPQITKLNVASKSTADGKLSVDIEVKAAE